VFEQQGREGNIAHNGFYQLLIESAKLGSPYKSMQVDFYQQVSRTDATNKNLQVNAS
jgi:hypothetical protein